MKKDRLRVIDSIATGTVINAAAGGGALVGAHDPVTLSASCDPALTIAGQRLSLTPYWAYGCDVPIGGSTDRNHAYRLVNSSGTQVAYLGGGDSGPIVGSQAVRLEVIYRAGYSSYLELIADAPSTEYSEVGLYAKSGSVSNAFYFACDASAAVTGTANLGSPLTLSFNSTVTNSVVTALSLSRGVTGGVGADGIGLRLSFRTEDADGTYETIGGIIARNTTAAHATQVSEMGLEVLGVTRFTLDSLGDGKLTNDLRVGGGLYVGSTATDPAAGTVTIAGTTGNILVCDTSVLVVDASNNRVGVNTASPSYALHVVGNSYLDGTLTATGICKNQIGSNYISIQTQVASDTTAHHGYFLVRKSRGSLATPTACNSSGETYGGIYAMGHDGTDWRYATQIEFSADGTPAANDMPGKIVFRTTLDGSTTCSERMRITNCGNVAIGGTAVRGTTVGAGVLHIFNGTAPAGTLSNGCSVYSASGELYTMDAAGNATLQTPHDDDGLWVFRSKNTVTGRVLKVDMERILKAVNARFGWDFVHEYAE